MRTAFAVATLTVAPFTANQCSGQPPVPTISAQYSPNAQLFPDCGEYMPGRVLWGELQAPPCDINPPQKLDLVLVPANMGVDLPYGAESPRYRCSHYGGVFHAHRDGTLRCNGIDY